MPQGDLGIRQGHEGTAAAGATTAQLVHEGLKLPWALVAHEVHLPASAQAAQVKIGHLIQH